MVAHKLHGYPRGAHALHQLLLGPLGVREPDPLVVQQVGPHGGVLAEPEGLPRVVCAPGGGAGLALVPVGPDPRAHVLLPLVVPDVPRRQEADGVHGLIVAEVFVERGVRVPDGPLLPGRARVLALGHQLVADLERLGHHLLGFRAPLPALPRLEQVQARVLVVRVEHHPVQKVHMALVEVRGRGPSPLLVRRGRPAAIHHQTLGSPRHRAPPAFPGRSWVGPLHQLAALPQLLDFLRALGLGLHLVLLAQPQTNGELGAKRRVVDHADHRVHLGPDVVGGRHYITVLVGDARGLGGREVRVPLDRVRVWQAFPLPHQLRVDEPPGVDVVELGLVVPVLPVRTEAHVRLDAVDDPSRDRVDLRRVLAQPEDALIARPGRVLGEGQVRDRARLIPYERPEAQDVRLHPPRDLDVQGVHVVQARTRLRPVIHPGPYDGLADPGVGARVLPLLQHVQVHDPRDDAESHLLGRAVRLLLGWPELRGRLVHGGVVRRERGGLVVLLVPGRGERVILDSRDRSGELGDQALPQLLRAVLGGDGLPQAVEQHREGVPLGGIVLMTVPPGLQQLGDELLRPGDDPGHGGLDLANLLVRVQPLAQITVVGHGDQGFGGVGLLQQLVLDADVRVGVGDQRVEHVDPVTEHILLVLGCRAGQSWDGGMVRGRAELGEAVRGLALGRLQVIDLDKQRARRPDLLHGLEVIVPGGQHRALPELSVVHVLETVIAPLWDQVELPPHHGRVLCERTGRRLGRGVT